MNKPATVFRYVRLPGYWNDHPCDFGPQVAQIFDGKHHGTISEDAAHALVAALTVNGYDAAVVDSLDD